MIELEGELNVFTQEGGFATDGIVIDGHDLGHLIREKLEMNGAEDFTVKARVQVQFYEDPQDHGGVGFFKQMGHSRGHQSWHEQNQPQ